MVERRFGIGVILVLCLVRGLMFIAFRMFSKILKHIKVEDLQVFEFALVSLCFLLMISMVWRVHNGALF